MEQEYVRGRNPHTNAITELAKPHSALYVSMRTEEQQIIQIAESIWPDLRQEIIETQSSHCPMIGHCLEENHIMQFCPELLDSIRNAYHVFAYEYEQTMQSGK